MQLGRQRVLGRTEAVGDERGPQLELVFGAREANLDGVGSRRTCAGRVEHAHQNVLECRGSPATRGKDAK